MRLFKGAQCLRGKQVLSWSTNFLCYLEPQVSLPLSREPTTCPYTEPDQSGPSPSPPQSHFMMIILMLVYSLCLGLASELFHSGFPTKTLYMRVSSPPVHATCLTRLILDLIARVVGEEYTLRSSLRAC